jgi:hypothetical protein
MATARWNVVKQPEGGFLLWIDRDPSRPLPAGDLTELEIQCRDNSICDAHFDDIRPQLERTNKATITVLLPGKLSAEWGA